MSVLRRPLWFLDGTVGLGLQGERPLVLPETYPFLDEVELLV